jgi:hypothetical protein
MAIIIAGELVSTTGCGLTGKRVKIESITARRGTFALGHDPVVVGKIVRRDGLLCGQPMPLAYRNDVRIGEQFGLLHGPREAGLAQAADDDVDRAARAPESGEQRSGSATSKLCSRPAAQMNERRRFS